MKKSISENIRFLRESKGFSQDFVAKKLKVTQQAYSQMEKNPDSMTLTRLRDLSKILDLELITLLGEENIYLQQNYNQKGGQAATKIVFNGSGDLNKDLYERLISELKDEILFLRNKK